MIWKCFKDEYPKSECGLIIKITDYSDKYYEVKDQLFYGYVFPNCDYIYLILNITSFQNNENYGQMSWKVLKDYDKESIFWYYDYAFSIPN